MLSQLARTLRRTAKSHLRSPINYTAKAYFGLSSLQGPGQMRRYEHPPYIVFENKSKLILTLSSALNELDRNTYVLDQTHVDTEIFRNNDINVGNYLRKQPLAAVQQAFAENEEFYEGILCFFAHKEQFDVVIELLKYRPTTFAPHKSYSLVRDALHHKDYRKIFFALLPIGINFDFPKELILEAAYADVGNAPGCLRFLNESGIQFDLADFSEYNFAISGFKINFSKNILAAIDERLNKPWDFNSLFKNDHFIFPANHMVEDLQINEINKEMLAKLSVHYKFSKFPEHAKFERKNLVPNFLSRIATINHAIYRHNRRLAALSRLKSVADEIAEKETAFAAQTEGVVSFWTNYRLIELLQDKFAAGQKNFSSNKLAAAKSIASWMIAKYEEPGDFDRALIWIKEFRQLIIAAYLLMGDCHAKTSDACDRELARQYYQKALLLDPNFIEAKHKLQGVAPNHVTPLKAISLEPKLGTDKDRASKLLQIETILKPYAQRLAQAQELYDNRNQCDAEDQCYGVRKDLETFYPELHNSHDYRQLMLNTYMLSGLCASADAMTDALISAWEYFQIVLEIEPTHAEAQLYAKRMEDRLANSGAKISKPKKFLASAFVTHSLPLVRT